MAKIVSNVCWTVWIVVILTIVGSIQVHGIKNPKNVLIKNNKPINEKLIREDEPPPASVHSSSETLTTNTEQDSSSSSSSLSKIHRNGFGSLNSINGAPGIFGVDKGAPDLQFGLALTIPFVSLATEKLINSLSQSNTHRGYRSWSDLASIFKLNISGIVLAAVVGIGALILIPTIFQGAGGGILKGFGSNLFDNLIPGGIGGGVNKHFGYGQYEHGGYDPWNKNYINSSPYGFQRSADGRSRALGDDEDNINSTSTSSSFWSKIQSGIASNWVEIETCGLYALCNRGKEAPMNSTFEDYMNKVSDLNPYLKQMEQAFQLGQQNKTIDCSNEFKECQQIPKFINSVGSYLFS